jgi:hypothetical protein
MGAQTYRSWLMNGAIDYRRADQRGVRRRAQSVKRKKMD